MDQPWQKQIEHQADHNTSVNEQPLDLSPDSL